MLGNRISQVGTARCAVRAAFSGATNSFGSFCYARSARYYAGGDAAARHPYLFASLRLCVFALIFSLSLNLHAEDAPKFLGAQSCSTSGCHGGADDKSRQYTVWSKYDVHHERPFATLTTARSERIAETLKLGNPTQAARCTVCHAPMQTVPADRLDKAVKISDGVSCENCHGPAENWIRSHTRKDYTHADRVHAGMRDLQNLYVCANTCVACHQNVDADILAAGHPELIFELDGQCVTQPKHWQETTNWNGAQAWLVGQAVALREALWLEKRERHGTNSVVPLDGLAASLPWSMDKIDARLPRLTVETTMRKWSDELAKAAANINWLDDATRKCLSAILSDSASGFRDKTLSQPYLAHVAQRLVLALDRLTLALPDAKAAEQLRAPLKKLFADVQSLPDFAPATFADHLAEFQKALPAAP
ncbi:MAG: multiheme c-type cytochrome [Verrucomicrobia bacterium]|nr:multiheme c-type cytochrome [Verrucomicrobiota bacterium]